MKLELKRVKISNSQSEETIAFVGFLYINGVKVAEVGNKGNGGPNRIYSYGPPESSLVKQAEEYCKALPEVPDIEGTGTLPMDLEFWISLEVAKLAEGVETKRFQKKIEKLTLKNIVIGNSTNPDVFRKFILPMPVLDLLNTKQGPEVLKRNIQRIKEKLAPEESIINKNIPKELL